MGEAPSSWDRALIPVPPQRSCWCRAAAGGRRPGAPGACHVPRPAQPPGRGDLDAEAFRGRAAVPSPRLSSWTQVPTSEKHGASGPPWFFVLAPGRVWRVPPRTPQHQGCPCGATSHALSLPHTSCPACLASCVSAAWVAVDVPSRRRSCPPEAEPPPRTRRSGASRGSPPPAQSGPDPRPLSVAPEPPV